MAATFLLFVWSILQSFLAAALAFVSIMILYTLHKRLQ